MILLSSPKRVFTIMSYVSMFCNRAAWSTDIYGQTFTPNFTEPILNMTVPKGRDITIRCSVDRLGGYRIGWVKADTKAIQAIHDHVVTHNTRVTVSNIDHTTWNLHIKNVDEEDAGPYMCQVNTSPMISVMGHLNVVIPPDFIPDDTSSDTMVPEGGKVKLTCRATGRPKPHVYWRREDRKEIAIREQYSNHVTRVATHPGEVLRLTKISRSDMGAYLCIASNGVPPSISKRIMVDVHFRPAIQVPNQLVGAPLGTDVTLECYVEASPKSINYWMRDDEEMVIASAKYDVQFHFSSLFEVRMVVVIRHFQKRDVGSYKCVAKNSLGEAESNIRLYVIPGPTLNYRNIDEEEYNEQFGSAEEGEENEERLLDRNRVRLANPRGARIKEMRPSSGSEYYPNTQILYPLLLILTISL